MKLLDPGPDFVWLGHDSFKITGDVVIYIDPYKLETAGAADKADLILITHEHGDHLAAADIKHLSTPSTVIIAPAECGPKLKGYTVQHVKPGDKITVKGVPIEAVPAYNLSKFRSPGVPFHPKEDGKVGFIITVNDRRIYHAGDTDLIPEMSGITCDIALIPVSGTYVMTAEEGVQAANLIKPKVAVPMHYAAIVGDENDAQKFKQGCKVPVIIMKKGVA